jgi:hypothetical protein
LLLVPVGLALSLLVRVPCPDRRSRCRALLNKDKEVNKYNNDNKNGCAGLVIHVVLRLTLSALYSLNAKAPPGWGALGVLRRIVLRHLPNRV